MSDNRRVLLLLLCGSILSPLSSGHAQSVSAAQPGASNQADTGQVEEITVTAQRRSEKLQDVPIAVSVFTASMAQAMGVADTSSLQTAVPGLEFTRVFNSAAPALRGIGANPTTSLGDESPIALYLDGVYISNPAGAIFSFNNIARVEVLKGPQGTLFGRNAAGGVVQVVTKDPSDTQSVDFSVGYGNYNTVTSDFYGTTPIVAGKLAADLAVHYENQMDGWGKNLFTGQDAFVEHDVALRSKWVLTPDDATKVTFSVDYDHSYFQDGIAMNPIGGAVFTDNKTTYMGYYNVSENPTGYTDARQYGGSVKVERDLEWSNFVSITGYRQVTSWLHADEDQTPAPASDIEITGLSKTFSQELQLQSPTDSPLQWIGGLYYYHDLASYQPLAIKGTSLGPLRYLNIYDSEITGSYAAFGQATATVATDTRLTAGLRYTIDHRHESGFEDSGFGVLVSSDHAVDFPKLTYKISLDHNFAEGVLGYIEYSRGFKSGIYNFGSPGSDPVRPEVLDAYEMGLKSDLLDKRLRLNAALYYYQFRDLQISAVRQNVTTLANAAASETKGADVDFEAVPMENLTLRGGASYIQSTFTSFPNAILSMQSPTGGDIQRTGSATGNTTPRSPKWTTNISAQYVVPTNAGTYTGNLTYYYNSGFYWDADNLLKNNAYHLVNASVDWQSPDGIWNVRLWGKNLLAQRYYIYATAQVMGNEASPAPPATFGATVSYHWE
jgi:iron complex outermembrane receptor protein